MERLTRQKVENHRARAHREGFTRQKVENHRWGSGSEGEAHKAEGREHM
jgi:hypothetical protein